MIRSSNFPTNKALSLEKKNFKLVNEDLLFINFLKESDRIALESQVLYKLETSSALTNEIKDPNESQYPKINLFLFLLFRQERCSSCTPIIENSCFKQFRRFGPKQKYRFRLVYRVISNFLKFVRWAK